MAVYSEITEKELILFLQDYDVGTLKAFKGILEGIENTNYKVITSKNTYILTLFEKRVKSQDLPFFINLKKHLIAKNFPCPKPITDKKGKEINILNGKSCVLISYIEGQKIELVDRSHCKQVGEMLSLLHKNTKDFVDTRKNSMDYPQWEKILEKCRSSSNNKYKDIINIIDNELKFLKSEWPNQLPQGIIHGDVFKDNVFFIENKISGLIDFYFSCNDFFIYDIALTINAWCFDNCIFDEQKFLSIIKGYETVRELKKEEKNSLSTLLRGAAIRILITRLHDLIFHQKEAFVNPKDPEEFFKILEFHQKNKIQNIFI